eukprot:Lankesteria_metandrocarpae@DN1000_c0_g1_i1.p1
MAAVTYSAGVDGVLQSPAATGVTTTGVTTTAGGGALIEPRGYQRTLAGRAMTENLIVVLATNAGKTLIANMVMHKYLSMVQHADKIVVFLVPTAVLVDQQLNAIDSDLIRMGFGPDTFAAVPLHGGLSFIDTETFVDWRSAPTWRELYSELSAFKEELLKKSRTDETTPLPTATVSGDATSPDTAQGTAPALFALRKNPYIAKALDKRQKADAQKASNGTVNGTDSSGSPPGELDWLQKSDDEGDGEGHTEYDELLQAVNVVWPRIFIMTPDTCLTLLTHGCMKMDRICLMVHDECHHAKKLHPYAVIQMDFYLRAPKEERPRMIGLTASPFAESVDSMLGSTLKETLHNLRSLYDAAYDAPDSTEGFKHNILNRNSRYDPYIYRESWAAVLQGMLFDPLRRLYESDFRLEVARSQFIIDLRESSEHAAEVSDWICRYGLPRDAAHKYAAARTKFDCGMQHEYVEYGVPLTEFSSSDSESSSQDGESFICAEKLCGHVLYDGTYIDTNVLSKIRRVHLQLKENQIAETRKRLNQWKESVIIAVMKFGPWTVSLMLDYFFDSINADSISSGSHTNGSSNSDVSMLYSGVGDDGDDGEDEDPFSNSTVLDAASGNDVIVSTGTKKQSSAFTTNNVAAAVMANLDYRRLQILLVTRMWQTILHRHPALENSLKYEILPVVLPQGTSPKRKKATAFDPLAPEQIVSLEQKRAFLISPLMLELEAKVTEILKGQSTPTQSAPIQSAPIQSAPIQPAPTQSAPAQPAPIQQPT